MVDVMHDQTAEVFLTERKKDGVRALPSPGEIRQQVERICEDALFLHSKRISDFLRFIVLHTLDGHVENLKERIIGIEVFGRAPDFDSGTDSAVRVAANQLRKRLAQYYAMAEHAAELQIEIPVGSYRAEAHYPVTAPSAVPAIAEDSSRQLAGRKTEKLWDGKKIASLLKFPHRMGLALFLLLVAALGVRLLAHRANPLTETDRFWSAVTGGSGPVMICIGSPVDPDWSLPMPRSQAADKVGVAPSFYSYEQRMNVGMMDLAASDHLVDQLRQRKVDYILRPIFGTQLATMRSSPLVLYGQFLNDLAIRFGGDSRFRLQMNAPQGLRWIEDTRAPEDKKWLTDVARPYDQIGYDYALISRVRDGSTGKWWIGIAGLTGVSTKAANDLLLDSEAGSLMLSGLPRGWEQKNLQIVLRVKIIQGNPGETQAVATAEW